VQSSRSRAEKSCHLKPFIVRESQRASKRAGGNDFQRAIASNLACRRGREFLRVFWGAQVESNE